jgi:DMSO/TMAO reductase YedYZ molybdopterin-dependent catalytic subunit
VPLRVLLNKCGITKATADAQHVCFRGPERELSHSERFDSSGDCTYGTSIPMNMALDPAADVVIAYKANHEELHPDHGYPLRVIIPGWVESRSVKWLTEIMISDKPTDNFHHYHDHAMLPPEVIIIIIIMIIMIIIIIIIIIIIHMLMFMLN